MRVSATKTAQRVERNQYSYYKKIQYYGANNDYPQKVLEIVNSSGTGKTCMDIYTKFIEGGGFADLNLAEFFLNERDRANSLLSKCAKDLRAFNGCAILVKYNGMYQIDSYHNIPFEHCRLEINDKKQHTGKIAVHPDWTNITGLTFNINDVKYFGRYNPEAVKDEIDEAGSPEDYLGQIYYFTVDGTLEYPISPFDPIITDMLTEESVSTVKHRNAKFNFLPSGILVRKGIRPNTIQGETADAQKDENEESREELKRLQGDENACKIWIADVDSEEEEPKFIPFDAKNYDKQYEYTERTVQENIGKMFIIPPILRGVDVGAGFGADLMKNAYDFMNSVVSDERRALGIIFKDILEFYSIQFTDFTILPKEYVSKNTKIDTPLLADLTKNERRSLIGFPEEKTIEAKEAVLAVSIGVGGTQALVAIVTDITLTPDQKIQLLIKLFSFTEEEAKKIMKV